MAIRSYGEDFAYLAMGAVLAGKLLLASPCRNWFIYRIKYAFYFFMTLLVTTCFIPVFIRKPRDPLNFRLMRLPTLLTGFIIGVKYSIRGNVRNLGRDAGFVVISNHQNTLDVIGMLNLYGIMRRCVTIAKQELFYIWPFGLSLWLSGTVFINRNNPSTSYKTLDRHAILMRKSKTKMWIFPEGTRNQEANTTKTLLPFKKGAFRIAIACQVPIVPVVNSPYYFVHKDYFGRGTLITEVLDPIPTEGLCDKDVEALMKKTWEVMQNKFQELACEVQSRC